MVRPDCEGDSDNGWMKKVNFRNAGRRLVARALTSEDVRRYGKQLTDCRRKPKPSGTMRSDEIL